MSVLFQPLSLPDPRRYAFRVGILATHWRGQLPTPGQTYNEISMSGLEKPCINDGKPGEPNSAFIYRSFQEGTIPSPSGQDQMGFWLYFGPDIPAEEKATPFRVTTIEETHDLDMVLTRLDFTQSQWHKEVNQRNGVTLQTPRWFVDARGFPAWRGPCKVVVEEFLSSTPFTDLRRYNPVPRMIQWDLPGATPGGFPACLHDRVFIPSSLNYETVESNGTVTGVGDPGEREGITYEPTNFTSWVPHYYSDDQKELPGGVWHRIRKKRYPPPIPIEERF